MTPGFTLIETILVLALIGCIARFSVVESLQFYEHATSKASSDQIATIQKAAFGASLRHVCDGGCSQAVAHGVHQDSESTILFQGDSFSRRDSDQDIQFPTPSSSTTSTYVYFPDGVTMQSE